MSPWFRRSYECVLQRDTNVGTGTLVSALSVGDGIGAEDVIFLQRLMLHYGVYRRYPLRPWPALKNAWRIVLR